METEQKITSTGGNLGVEITYSKDVGHLRELFLVKEDAILQRLDKIESGEIRRQDTKNQWKFIIVGYIMGILTTYGIPLLITKLFK